MRKENKDLLLAAGPTIFSNGQIQRWGVDCSNGWLGILLELVNKLESRQSTKSNKLVVLQIKEKFGTLRFYAENVTSQDALDIKIAEAASIHTCEECGQPGKLKNDGWMRTMCEPCFEEWVSIRNKKADTPANEALKNFLGDYKP